MKDNKKYLVIITGDIADGDSISKSINLYDINYGWFGRERFLVDEQLELIDFVSKKLKEHDSRRNLEKVREIFGDEIQKWEEFMELVEGIIYGGYDTHIHTLEEIQVVDYNEIKKYKIDE